MPKLKGVAFETAIIERYRRRETSVEEALIEMYLAGVSVRRVEDITEALWGTKVSPGTISNLNNTTMYEFYVRSACGGTDYSYWSNSTQGSTTMVPVGLPYTADFADSSDTWVLNGGNCTNYWVRGTVNNEASLFVTNNGTTPGYTMTTSSANAAQKLFTVGTSDTITITFDVMVDGEGGYDYLKLFLAPASTQFLPSTSAPGSYSVPLPSWASVQPMRS